MNSPPHKPDTSTEAFDASLIDNAQTQLAPEDELLVAYLDGELDATARTQLESQLSNQPKLRERMEQLRSAWDLLDDLPTVEPDPNFTQSTIEMVALSAVNVPSNLTVGRKRWWLGAWLLLVPIAIATGYIATRAWQRAQERWAIEQLHVLADLEAFEDAGSFEWLEKLHQLSDLQRVSKRAPSNSSLGVGVVPQSISQRRSWIASLSSTDRDRLSANLERFTEYPRTRSNAERQRIINLANKVYASSDPEGYLQTARSYAVFLSDMNVSDRASHLDETDLDRRLDDLTHRVNRKLIEVYVNELTPQSPDRQTVEEWKRQMREKYEFDDERGDSIAYDLARRLAFRSSVIEGTDLNQLLKSLTPEAQEILERLHGDALREMALIMYFVNPVPPRRPVDRSAAMEQFQKYPREQQIQLEFWPPEKVQSELGLGNEPRRRPFRGNRS